MEQIRDTALLNRLMEQKKVLNHFQTRDLKFRLVRYEKGEMLSTPLEPMTDLLFVVHGKIKIYGLREEGSMLSVSLTDEDAFLGDMEFVRRDFSSLYAEAQETVLCIALSIERNRSALDQDNTFLRFLLQSISYKVLLFSLIGHPSQPIEDRVVTYLREIRPDHTLHSINAGLLQFHCSRSQLQRVVKKLCEDGTLEKIGKGKYRLV